MSRTAPNPRWVGGRWAGRPRILIGVRRPLWTVPAAAALVLCAACTGHSTASAPSGASSASASPSVSSGPSTVTASPADTSPLAAAPTTTADGTCPFLTLDQALDDIGERLGRVTVSTSAGAPVGCTFYPATGALASSEHLPPADTPVIGITVTRYADETAAHNAMVESSRVDPSANQETIPGADEAIAFATTYYPPDGDQDRAFTFRKGTAVVLVLIAQTASYNALHIGTDVAPTIS